MKFSVLFESLDSARKARRELLHEGLLRWSDVTSLHHQQIRLDRLPLSHTRARRSAVLGALIVGVVSAVLLATVAANQRIGIGVGMAVALGVGAGLLYGGVFGTIAYSTRPTDEQPDDATGGALLVCNIPESDRAEEVRERLEAAPSAVPS